MQLTSGTKAAPAPIAPIAGQAASGGAGAASPPVGTAGSAPPRAATPLAGAAAPDLESDAGAAEPPGQTMPPTAAPGSFKLFDKIPMFGMYVSTDPKNFKPPPGVLLWSHGTAWATKLSREHKAQLGADLSARITYHAQCDNYDRLGGVFFVSVQRDQVPTETDARTELARFITPFSNYQRGALATYVFPTVDISSYAGTLADSTNDVWVGIGGGSNPYDGDPCTNTNQTEDFKAIGYKYSLEFVSSKPLAAAKSVTLTGLYAVQAMTIPVMAKLENPGAALRGRVTVIVSGHGSESGGDEYQNTMDTLSVNGKAVGMFNTKVDCASYAKFSPDGNQGIFSGNNANNPRNWCPGSLVLPHTFDAMLDPGSNTISLTIEPARVPSGSYYSTSISFSAP